MAAMSTALTEYSDLGDKRTYTTSGHTISKPKLVISSRKIPVGNQVMAEYTFQVLHATEDDDGAILAQKPSVKVIATQPINGQTTDFDAVLVIARDIMASDEYTASVASANHLQ